MLSSPEPSFFQVSQVISGNVFGICLHGTVGYRILNHSITSDLSFFVHCLRHPVESRAMINVFNPRSHDMYRTENHITLLLTCKKAGKSSCNAVRFYTVLVKKHISQTPTGSKCSDDF